MKNNKKYKKMIKMLTHNHKNIIKSNSNVNNVLKYKDYLINKLYLLLNYYKNNVIKSLVDKNYSSLKKINELNLLINNFKKNNSILLNNISSNKANIQKLNNFIQDLLKKLFDLKNNQNYLNGKIKELTDKLFESNETLKKDKAVSSFSKYFNIILYSNLISFFFFIDNCLFMRSNKYMANWRHDYYFIFS